MALEGHSDRKASNSDGNGQKKVCFKTFIPIATPPSPSSNVRDAAYIGDNLVAVVFGAPDLPPQTLLYLTAQVPAVKYNTATSKPEQILLRNISIRTLVK